MAKYPNDDLFSETTMSFGEHLEELRVSLFRALAGLIVGFLVGLLIANHVVRWVQRPLKNALEEHYIQTASTELTGSYGDQLPAGIANFINDKRVVYEEIYVERREALRLAELAGREGGNEELPPPGRRRGDAKAQQAGTAAEDTVEDDPLSVPDVHLFKTRIWRPIETKIVTLNAQEAFMIWLKAGFFSGIILASPWIFWQIWNFVAAGLYPHEKRYVYLFLPISLILFWAGVGLAFFFVFQYVLDFLFSFNRRLDIHTEPRISEWLSFCLLLPVGFGVAFQLPLVMLFLERIGIFSVHVYLEKWRVAILVIFVIAMVLTPADPISMLSMALPLTALYFLGVGMCHWLPRSRSPFAEAYEP